MLAFAFTNHANVDDQGPFGSGGGVLGKSKNIFWMAFGTIQVGMP